MKKMLLSAFILLPLLTSAAHAQSSSRDSLDLPGCSIQDLTAGSDPASASFLILAACNSTYGLHYTRTFGGTWASAAGGSYSVGAVRQAKITPFGAFILVGSDVLRSDLPTSTSTYTPSWSSVSALSGTSELSSYGKFLVAIHGSSVTIYNTETNAVTQDISFPTSATGTSKVRVGPDFLYVLATPTGSPTEALFRTTFDATAGTSSGTWTDLSAATGLTFDSNDDIWNYFVNPINGNVYLGIRVQPAFSDLMYVSTDDGASYTSTGVTAVANHMSFSADGNTIIMGSAASTNGGTTWVTLSRGNDGSNESDGRLEDSSSVINQTNAAQALHTTNEGVDLTSTLSSATPTWTKASTGLEGTQVYVVSQSTSSADRVVLGTSAGVAVTSNFNDASVTWNFPLCPGNDCVGGENVFIDPSNNNQIYYGSGNIRRCDISDVANISCSVFSDKPNNNVNFSVFRIYDALPNVLVAGYVRTEGATDGGLYFYDVNTPTSVTIPTALTGIPVNSFIPLSTSVMFAGAGTSSLSEAAYRGIYKSSDGGTSFTEMTDSDLSELVLVNGFAYDETNDILYAATQAETSRSGTIYHLASASAGGTDWIPATTTFTNENFSDVAVDSDNGDVYASAGNDVYISTDGGVTFTLLLSGPEGETTSDLEVTDTGATSGSSVGIRANTKRIIQATSTGVYALAENEESQEITCKLAIKGCSGKVRKGTRCTFTVTAKDAATNAGVAATFQLQRRATAMGAFTNLGRSATTTARGKKTLMKRAQKGAYRAVFSDPECTTTNKNIRVR